MSKVSVTASASKSAPALMTHLSDPLDAPSPKNYNYHVKCPRCIHRIHAGADICPHCGFSMEIADRQFGSDDLQVRRLTDRAGVLRHEDREKVQLAMGRFSRKFPQLFLAVYTDTLDQPEDLRPFSFWLLNRSAFDDVPVDMPNENGILLSIDPESRHACITYGYLLDEHLNEELTFDCLARAHGHWLEERFADGILRVIDRLETLLSGLSRKALSRSRNTDKRAIIRGRMDMVKPLRDGHRSPVQKPGGEP